MKTRLLFCSIMLLTGILFSSCKPNDEKLQKEVTAALNAIPGVSAVVKDGVATLSGIVEEDALKGDAEKVASGVKSIKSVVNNIEVKKPEPEPVISPDEALKNTINTALSGKGEKFKDVVVEVKDGVVNLTGLVKRADLQELMQIANEANPKKVNNLLNIRK